jgi:hypothetical protein
MTLMTNRFLFVLTIFLSAVIQCLVGPSRRLGPLAEQLR